MKNRESLYPGRVKLTPVDAANGIYDLVRADEPQEEGTPLNKKLLDFAVAACGVTAGTATAYTLDDEFGGFELVDGAKVNFRLHVASGANPTLNVNGTGAKALKNMLGGPFAGRVDADAWIHATFSKEWDCYVVDGGSMSVWKSKTEANTKDISIELPGGYSAYRLKIFTLTNGSSSYYVTLKTNAILTYATSGVNWHSTAFSRTGESGNSTVINTGIAIDGNGGTVDLTIIKDGVHNRIHGLVYTHRGMVEVATVPTQNNINEIHLTTQMDYGYYTAGTTIILEGIA